MNTTTNYQENTVNNNFCTDNTVSKKSKTKKEGIGVRAKIGALSRIIVSALAGLAFFAFVFFYGITAYDSISLKMIYELTVSVGGSIMVSTMIWSFMKWSAFILPRSFSIANEVWRSWYALTPFGLVIKAVVWVGMVSAPVSWISVVATPMAGLLALIVPLGNNIFAALLITTVSLVVYMFLVALDVARIMGVKITKLFRQKQKTACVNA